MSTTTTPAMRLSPDRAGNEPMITITGPAMAALLEQTGLSRDQIRWGLQLAMYDRMSSIARMRKRIAKLNEAPTMAYGDDDHADPLLLLSELLVEVGAGDIESREDYNWYLESLTEVR